MTISTSRPYDYHTMGDPQKVMAYKRMDGMEKHYICGTTHNEFAIHFVSKPLSQPQREDMMKRIEDNTHLLFSCLREARHSQVHAKNLIAETSKMTELLHGAKDSSTAKGLPSTSLFNIFLNKLFKN